MAEVAINKKRQSIESKGGAIALAHLRSTAAASPLLSTSSLPHSMGPAFSVLGFQVCFPLREGRRAVRGTPSELCGP